MFFRNAFITLSLFFSNPLIALADFSEADFPIFPELKVDSREMTEIIRKGIINKFKVQKIADNSLKIKSAKNGPSQEVLNNYTQLKMTGDCRGCIIVNINLPNIELAGDLADSTLSFSNLSGANINPVTSFQNTYMYGINLSNSKFTSVKFYNVVLDRADLSKSDASNAVFIGSSLYGADLREANLRRTKFNSINLRGANLSRTSLNGADFKDTNLKAADLSNINASGISFKNCILSHTNFSGAKLDGAVFINTDLTGANLQVKSMTEIFLDPHNNILCETKLPWGIDNSGCGRVYNGNKNF